MKSKCLFKGTGVTLDSLAVEELQERVSRLLCSMLSIITTLNDLQGRILWHDPIHYHI